VTANARAELLAEDCWASLPVYEKGRISPVTTTKRRKTYPSPTKPLVPYFPENWCQNFRNPQGQRAAQGNRNTELKAKIFDEALERLQKRLAVLEEKSAE
jgi:hypothetical protein